ncbi:hypothetical protein AB0C34_17810 [Nocardia sp. NPDC049220]|uniref:hypothetical protein n=1 Tax=Nocardia sp. NPDC049220 TaxID=3155273 RepID=UPI0033DED607
MNTSTVRTQDCGIPWCVTCVLSADPDDRPHRHHDLALKFDLSRAPFRITIERSCHVYGDGTQVTTIDIVRYDRRGFGVEAQDALPLADLLRDPDRHYGREETIELAETDVPLIVAFVDSPAHSDPRDYLLHVTQGGGHYFKLTQPEARRLGDILHGFGHDKF